MVLKLLTTLVILEARDSCNLQEELFLRLIQKW